MTDGLLDQDEIDALLGNTSETSSDESSDSPDASDEELLSEVEKDTLGEIGNISMGTSATTLSTLLNQKVTITTPKVTITNIDELSEFYPIPFVAIDVKYKVGVEGANLLILRVSDVKIIADLMMGGDGKDLEDAELTDIDLSAIGEAMNQMVGSSSTSLSTMIGKTIDIEPPKSYTVDFKEDKLDLFESEEEIVKISFKMVAGDLIDSEIMQLVPISFAKQLVESLNNPPSDEEEEEVVVEEPVQAEQPAEPQQQVEQEQVVQEQPQQEIPIQDQQPVQPQQPAQEQQAQYQQPVQPQQQPQQQAQPQAQQQVNTQPVNVSAPNFQQFDQASNQSHDVDINIIQDIPVEITVQLGKTMRKIGEILEYGPGTIIELDKLLGEPLEIFANEKYIAKGEVVVIEDNFGIRVTEIVSPSKRIQK